MNWRRAFIAVLIIAPLLVVLALGFRHDPREVPSVLEGRRAPDFSLLSLQGDAVSSASLRGKPALLNFWSTWCVPCKAEHELLQQAALAFGDRVRFLGIIYQDDEQAARRYLSTRSNHYPQLIDSGSKVAIDYGVAGVPESFILDAEGSIRHKQVGIMTQDALIRVLRPLTEGAGTP